MIVQESLSKQSFPPGLYIVSTPIGNIADISFRAIEVFKRADLIVCEDTRVTGPLLKILKIKKPLYSYHDHNASQQRPKILQILAQNKMVALVSDAGTPLISDPGYKLVKACQEKEIHVTAIPGPVAFIDALVLSGLPTDKFFFGGFLPDKKGAKEKTLQSYATFAFPLIFYEAPSRLTKTLQAINTVLGTRPLVLAKELTKKFETVLKGSSVTLLQDLSTQNLKGEFVLIIGPGDTRETQSEDISVYRDIAEKYSLKEGATQLAKKLNKPRREVYQRLLEIRKQQHFSKE